MFSFSLRIPLLALALLAAASDALYAPRSRHSAHLRHAAAIHARSPIPDALPVPVPAPIANASLPSSRRVRKRQDGKCKPRPSSVAPSSTASSAAATHSSAAGVPQNVEGHPTTQVQTSQAHSTTSTTSSSTTSVAPPPSKTSTQHSTQAPAPTTSASSSAAPKATTSSSSNSGGGGGGGAVPFPGFFTGPNTGGDGTFYTPGLGACGGTNNEGQLVVAVPFGLFNSVPGYNGANPNNNPVCGQHITVSYQGKSVRVQVVDECAGCNNPLSLDMSPAAFNQLADPSVGRLHDISWVWS